MKLTEAFGFCLCGGWIRRRKSPHGVLSFGGSGILGFPEWPTLPLASQDPFWGLDGRNNTMSLEQAASQKAILSTSGCRQSITLESKRRLSFWAEEPTQAPGMKDVIGTIGGESEPQVPNHMALRT